MALPKPELPLERLPEPKERACWVPVLEPTESTPGYWVREPVPREPKPAMRSELPGQKEPEGPVSPLPEQREPLLTERQALWKRVQPLLGQPRQQLQQRRA
jgi:hypothetical protein